MTKIDAVTTIPNSSNTLIDRSFQSLTVARSHVRTSSSNSKRYHTPNPGAGPQKCLPMASPEACDHRVNVGDCV